MKLTVLGAERDPYAHNPTGLLPQLRENAMIVLEMGFSPGQKASSVRAFDNVESRKGYSGLYQFGAAYNPATSTNSTWHTVAVRQLPAVLDGHTGALAGRSRPGQRFGRPVDVNFNKRLLTSGLRPLVEIGERLRSEYSAASDAHVALSTCDSDA